MSTLATLLAQAADGGLRGLTLYRTSDGRWQASRSLDGVAWSIQIDPDPIKAIEAVLDAPRMSEVTTNKPDVDLFS